MFVSFFVCCVGSGLCNGLMTRPEESYWLCVCLIVFDIETLMTWPGPELGCCATGKNFDLNDQATKFEKLSGSAGKDPSIRKSVLDGGQ